VSIQLTDDEAATLADEVAAALDHVDDQELNNTIGFRDDHLAALLDALIETDHLSTLVDDAAAQLGKDAEPTRSDAVGLLIRIGLAEAYPEVIDAARDGYKDFLLAQVGEF
jgi:hypothetical protein